MRRQGIQSIVIFLSSCLCFLSCKQKTEDIIAGINKTTRQINSKLNDYKSKRVDDITNAGGGYITGYYRDDEVKKVIAEHYYDSSRSFTEYYFDDGFLIFVSDMNYLYNRPRSYTQEKARANGDSVWYDDKKTKLQVSTFYLHKNNLIKWIDFNSREVQPGTSRFLDRQSALWAETKVLLLQLKEE